MTDALEPRAVRGAFDLHIKRLEKALADFKELADDIVTRLEADE